jgi:hypothetical protein
VAEEHLAGDFGVDGVGVVEEWWCDEGEAGIEDKPEGDEDEAVAARLEMRLWGCGGHVNSV